MTKEQELYNKFHEIAKGYLQTKIITGNRSLLENLAVSIYHNIFDTQRKSSGASLNFTLHAKDSTRNKEFDIYIYDRGSFPEDFYIPSYIAVQDSTTKKTAIARAATDPTYETLFNLYTWEEEDIQRIIDLLIEALNKLY